MIFRRVLVPLAAAALVLSGCGGDGGAKANPTQANPGNDDFTEGEVKPTSKTARFGQPATVAGADGGHLTVTPVGVLYHRGPYTSGLEGPANGWYAAVALRVEAVGGQDRPLAPAEGGGWRWRAGEQQIDTVDGNTATSPWVGEVPEFGDPILPGRPQAGVVTFDVPAKGGELQYVAADGSVTSWTVPAADTGSGLDKVRARIKLFS